MLEILRVVRGRYEEERGGCCKLNKERKGYRYNNQTWEFATKTDWTDCDVQQSDNPICPWKHSIEEQSSSRAPPPQANFKLEA